MNTLGLFEMGLECLFLLVNNIDVIIDESVDFQGEFYLWYKSRAVPSQIYVYWYT